MSISSFITITIDGQRHFVAEGDFDPRFWEAYSALEYLNNGSPIFKSDSPPVDIVARGIGEKWASKVHQLQERLKQVTGFTTMINAGVFRSRLSLPLRHKLEEQRGRLRVLAASTRSVAVDDGSRGANPHAMKYAQIYGVREESIPKIPIWMEIPYDDCEAFLEAKGRIPGRREGILVRRLLLVDDALKTGVFVKHFCSARGYLASENFGPAAAFLWQFRAEIDQAVDILSSRHPNIPRANLVAAFLELCFVEFSIFDNTDVYQDAAAADYSESPFVNSFRAILPKEGWRKWAAPFVQGFVWRLFSAVSGVKTTVQGLGPLQIIPDLALAALRRKDLFAAYEGLVQLEDFLDEEGNESLENLLRAQFNPKTMFALKAMTWDLQLAQMEAIEGLSIPIVERPHPMQDGAAEAIALLYGARQMVQFPTESVQAFPKFLESNFSEYLTRLYLIGHLQGVAPQLEGIRRVIHVGCPPESFGYYQIGEGTKKVCLFSE